MSISASLSKATAKHCVAIMPCLPSKVIFQGSDNHNDGQGTLTLVEYNDRLYGVTNEHVVKSDEKELSGFLVAIKKHTFINRKPIFTSKINDLHFPYDIAIFDLEDMRNEFYSYGKQGVILNDANLKADELFLAVGFPGDLREKKERGIMAHSLAHIVIECRGFSENRITAFSSANDLNEAKRTDFGGISGGALFKVLDDDSPEYELVGICYEGRGTKPDASVDERELRSDIWIFGYPLNKKAFGEMLKNSN